MDISELIGETTDFEMDWKGKKVKFTAQTESLTPHLLNNIKNAADYACAVCGVVTDWDLTDKDPKKKWPLDEDHVAKLPVAFLSAILDRIGESWSGEKKSGTTSESGSAAMAN